MVFAKRPFAGPQAVLAYLARYTHRVAISNARLIRLDDKGVTFKWKDYRIKGRDRLRTMTLDAAKFIRRFLPAASIASATTACSPARFERTTSSAFAKRSPRPRSRPRARRPSKRALCRVAAWSCCAPRPRSAS